VIGDVSAAVGGVKFDPLLPQHRLGSEQIRTVRVPSQSDDVGMLTKQKNIVDRADFPSGHDAPLQLVGLRPRDKTEVGDQKMRHDKI